MCKITNAASHTLAALFAVTVPTVNNLSKKTLLLHIQLFNCSTSAFHAFSAFLGKFRVIQYIYIYIVFNPQHTCAARVTVLGLCVSSFA